MANRSSAANAICPFYLREYERTVTCEGVLCDTEVTTRFKSARDKEIYQEYVCQSYKYAERCPFAALLMREHAQ